MSNELRDVRCPPNFAGMPSGVSARASPVWRSFWFCPARVLRDQAAPMDQAEQRVIEQRLKDLGYI